MRTDWKAYFHFSKKDRIAAIILLILIIAFCIAPFFYHPFNNQPIATVSTLDQELAKQDIDTTVATNEQIAFIPPDESETINSSTNELFQFDPNTLDAIGFKRLGLHDNTINTILKYRSKGGHFWKADDFRKIYSLRKNDADRLIPYVQITGQQTVVKEDKKQINYSKAKPDVIDINIATVEEWKALPAIGDVLANRIVKFRDKIGSFTSIAQVKQTYGLSDSAFQAIEPYLAITSTPQKIVTPEKININTASVGRLKSNPHISGEIAQAIVIYRSQHGNFSAVDDVKKIVFINEETFKQIAPYLTVD